MAEQYIEILHLIEHLNKLVIRAQKIGKIQTIKIRNLASRILHKSFNEKVEPNPTEDLGMLGGLALKSAIKKWQRTYQPGEFSESVKHAFFSNQRKIKQSRTRLYYALNKIQKNEAKDLFQVMKITREQGPNEAIDNLLKPKRTKLGQIVVELYPVG